MELIKHGVDPYYNNYDFLKKIFKEKYNEVYEKMLKNKIERKAKLLVMMRQEGVIRAFEIVFCQKSVRF